MDMDFRKDEVSSLRTLAGVLARAIHSHDEAARHQAECPTCSSLNLINSECAEWERLARELHDNMAAAKGVLIQHPELFLKESA